MVVDLFIWFIVALTVWAHPTNTIDPADTSWVALEFGRPNGGVADAWPGRDGLCHIRVNPELWAIASVSLKELIMVHEVGHCVTAVWEPDKMHTGNGVMGCGYVVNSAETCMFTAYDQFLADAAHPSAIKRRVTIPMVTR